MRETEQTERKVRDALIRAGLYDAEGFIREDVNDAIREAVRRMPPNIDAPQWIGAVQIVRAAFAAAMKGATE